MTSFPTRRARRRAPLSWFLPVALLAGGCLDDRGLGPEGPAARLALRAQVGALAVTGLRLEGAYARSDQSGGALATQSLELPAGVAPGTSVDLPVTIDLAACLADPLAVPGGGACTVTLTLVLLDGARELDRVTVGPLVLRPGETSTPAPVELREVAGVAIDAPADPTLRPGGTLDLAAQVVDGAGAPLAERAITWTSDAPAVAGVATTGATTARVTGLAAGTARIRASGGGRTAEVAIVVRPAPRIAADVALVRFTAVEREPRPIARAVALTNASGGPMDGLAVSGVTYDGARADWLETSLSATTAPATLTLRPTRTDLPLGLHTATVHVVAEGAANAPFAVEVTYEVTTSAQLAVSPSAITFDLNDGLAFPYDAGIAVTAEGLDEPAPWSIDETIFTGSPTNWLGFAAVSPCTPATISVSPVRFDVPPGTYTADLFFDVVGVGNGPLPVRVTYIVPDFTQFSYSVDAGGTTSMQNGETISIGVSLVHPEGHPVDGIPVEWEVVPASAGSYSSFNYRTGGGILFTAGSFVGVATVNARLGAAVASVQFTLNMAPVMAPVMAPSSASRTAAQVAASAAAPSPRQRVVLGPGAAAATLAAALGQGAAIACF